MKKARRNHFIKDLLDFSSISSHTMNMKRALVKHSGVIVPHSDLRAGTARDFVTTEKRKENKYSRIGTWNVRTLLQMGKLENLKQEMKKMKMDILGVSEMRWPNCGDFWSDEYRIIHTGTIEDRLGAGGVGVVLNRKMGQRVKGFVQYGGRIILVSLDTKPTETIVIQVYMPTTNQDDEEVEAVYEELNGALRGIKGETNLIVMGDWNAIVGDEAVQPAVGLYGLGKRNERGDRLVEFCNRNQLVISNTWFQHHPRRRYTWKSPGDRNRYQIDYILVKSRFKNQLKDSRAYASPDIDSDHNMVVVKCQLKFKCLKKKTKDGKLDMGKLENHEMQRMFQEKAKDLVHMHTTENIEQQWKNIKEGLIKAAEETIGKQRPEKRKEWITNEIIIMFEERRKLKNSETEEGKTAYRALRNKINRELKKAKETFLEDRCKEVDDLLQRGNIEVAYQTVKRFFSSGQRIKCNALIGEDNTLVYNQEDIAITWKVYLEKLYGGNVPDELVENENEVDNDDLGDSVMRSEFEQALQALKQRKAPGIDALPAELIKTAGIEIKDKLYKLTCQIYDTGVLPEDFKKCIIVPLPKKMTAKTCAQYRTLSLTSHASKILTTIILRRIEGNVERMLTEDQFGFRKGRGTREAIMALRLIIEKRLEKGKDTYIAFIDLEKAFDKVDWKELFKILRGTGAKYKDRRIIWSLYKEEEAIVRCGDHQQQAKINQGVRQGCALSPVLFNMYIQKALDEIRERIGQAGVRIQGRNVDMLRFADDIAVLAESEEELQVMMEVMENTLATRYNMKINKSKTKILVANKQNRQRTTNIRLNGEKLKDIQDFVYLGSRITSDGRSRKDVISRINQGKIAFYKRKGLFTSNRISLSLRKRLIKTFVWSVLLYGSETWTLGVDERRRIEGFEMWCLRRMLKIPWTARMTNEEVLQRAEETPVIWRIIKKRRDIWMGHILRHESLLHTIVEGSVDGKKARGRPRRKYISQIMQDLGCGSYTEMKRRAGNRTEWRAAANQS